MTAKYELIEHTADIFIKAYGDTLAQAYAAVAEAMFLQMVDEAAIALEQQIDLTIEGTDQENLLVAFLSKLIVIHETEGLVLGQIELTLESETSLYAVGWGERFDERKHAHGLMFKAVSYHLLEIVPPHNGAPASVKVLFDI